MDTLQTKAPFTNKDTRILFKIHKNIDLPTVVFFGGIHGNEKAGVTALKQLQSTIDTAVVKGNVYGVLGNLKALEEDQRYIDEDLNRLWTKAKIELTLAKKTHNTEETQLLELLTVLHNILKENKGPFYFIDLHTTSSKTLPFITINDALINRRFSKLFPVPIVLGIEEYLEGALLSYINTLGYVSIGFESGQHTDYSSVENNIAFIHLALVFSGILDNTDTDVQTHLKTLKLASENDDDFYEIVHLQNITSNDNFKMKGGFKSFQPITKGTPIAHFNNTEIRSDYNGHIFMPLYQNKGNEGFFIIKPIKPFFLKLSTVLRRVKTDSLLACLPGVSWINKNEGILQVNLTIAKFLAKPLFHLLGYRNREITSTHLRLNNRERVAKTKIYKREPWY
ncbi:succinylglutamate desuccinylase [Jejuia pallidilutea]|uniref:Succinylglutamate desuccinylase n=1 Tax=Jejuia pallidilutea TaxID=504487 RepID=A0A362X4P9_9FLAO|nr:succinylglutamate desuccinylase/aspartoacylase family protein [Jejuia pallidilutea]PQV49579.1 succinylglutamate desuccinylase [Jejuia pallidilutea]